MVRRAGNSLQESELWTDLGVKVWGKKKTVLGMVIGWSQGQLQLQLHPTVPEFQVPPGKNNQRPLVSASSLQLWLVHVACEMR
jgi:hypothetical protein